ncbi:MAG TPA: hypothetical protein VF766_07935 [Pyrinomonadaceae bacterium]
MSLKRREGAHSDESNTYSVGGLIPGLFGEDLGAAAPPVAPLGAPPEGAAVVDGDGAAVGGGAVELL